MEYLVAAVEGGVEGLKSENKNELQLRTMQSSPW